MCVSRLATLQEASVRPRQRDGHAATDQRWGENVLSRQRKVVAKRPDVAVRFRLKVVHSCAKYLGPSLTATRIDVQDASLSEIFVALARAPKVEHANGVAA